MTGNVDAFRQPVVYFLCEAMGAGWDSSRNMVYVKIGATSGNPDARRACLQTGNPRKLEIFRTLPGTQRVERRFHQLLAEYRVSGEWFQLPGSLVAHLHYFPAERAQALFEETKARFADDFKLVLEAA